MKVKDLIAKLQKLPRNADVYIDCSSDYAETRTIGEARCWKDYPEDFREGRRYGWSTPGDMDVFLW